MAAILLALSWPSMYHYVEEYSRMQVVDELRKHPTCEKFKSKYPDAEEKYALWGDT